MLDKTPTTLSTLPVEILHQIFNELDGLTILLSVRNVCQQLRAASHSYNQYALDFTSTSKVNFRRLLSLIDPKSVIAVTLCNRGITPRQVGVFRSLIDIEPFTRLRSLTVQFLTGYDLCCFLVYIRRCSLTSLTLRSTIINPLHKEQIAQCLSTIIAQPTFVRLDLLCYELCDRIDQLKWPSQCKLRSMTMEFYTAKRLIEVLRHAPDLRTLMLGTRVDDVSSQLKDADTSLFTPHQRLSYLTLSNCSLPMHEIQSLLSFMPFLTHLRVISTDPSMLDGSRWEDLIERHLSALIKFEFYIQLSPDRDGNAAQLTLDCLIAPFCTLFWTEENQWAVTCNWFPTHNTGEIYTSPICQPNYVHRADPNALTVSNFVSDVQPTTTIPEAVLQLHVKPYRSNCCDDRTTDQWFPNVTDLCVSFHNSCSTELIPSVVDFCKVTKLSLHFDFSIPLSKCTSGCLIDLLRQTSNVRSLSVDRRSDFTGNAFVAEKICSTIIRYLDRSKLRHLKIPVGNLNDVEMLLDQFRDLSSITFTRWMASITTEQIVRHAKTLMDDCSTLQSSLSVSIWMGERLETANWF